jgi:hypothetical protein
VDYLLTETTSSGAEGISLDQWEKIGQLKERTRAYLQRPEVKANIDELAETLLRGNPHGLNLGHLGELKHKTHDAENIADQLEQLVSIRTSSFETPR